MNHFLVSLVVRFLLRKRYDAEGDVDERISRFKVKTTRAAFSASALVRVHEPTDWWPTTPESLAPSASLPLPNVFWNPRGAVKGRGFGLYDKAALCLSFTSVSLLSGFLVGRAAGIYFPLFPDLACVGGCREGMGKGGGDRSGCNFPRADVIPGGDSVSSVCQECVL